MCDKMAISAYILNSRKGPISKASNESEGNV